MPTSMAVTDESFNVIIHLVPIVLGLYNLFSLSNPRVCVSIQDCAGAYGPCAGALLISILQTMCSGALQLEIP